MLLQARGRMTARDLAGELEVSERTIYRDVDDLTRFGLDRNLSSLRRENR